MSLSIGIVGLPNVGKSTLFNALTDNNILAANYPFATIEPNTGIVPIPDPRLNVLSKLYNNAPVKPATVTFVDIAGLVAGASQGEGLGNQFLAHIRTTNAIVQVVRAFEDPNVQHVDNQHDLSVPPGLLVRKTGGSDRQAGPKKDIDVINTELVLADLQTVERRLPQLEKLAKANPKLKSQADFLVKIKQILNEGTPLFSSLSSRAQSRDLSTSVEMTVSDVQKLLLQELQLLTTKPIIYLFNVDEQSLSDEAKQTELKQLVAPSQALFVCAKLEAELNGLDENDRVELLESYGQKDSGLIQLIHAAYEVLGLQSYLTAGDKEVRAWTIAKGSTAPQAAGVIHGDFERGFIAAEVVSYPDLIATGSITAAKASGKVRTEGKTYIMQPNDVVEFRFNV